MAIESEKIVVSPPQEQAADRVVSPPQRQAADRVEGIKQAADSALEIILLFDENGNIEYGNKKAEVELGFADGLTGMNVAEFFHTDLQMDSEECFSLEKLDGLKDVMMYRKNGTCFPAKISINANLKHKILLYAINIATQIETERKLALVKEESEDVMKMRNEFVANVTHELRTPVNGIKGHVGNLMKQVIAEEQRQTLEIIDRCCQNMSQIISSILDFSKLESGKFTIEEEEFDFYKMLDYVVETNIPLVNAKGLHILVNIDNEVPKIVIGDELRLTQILNNLISNAVKFTEAGYVSIAVTRTVQFDDEVELFCVVSDTGIGISPEEKDRLFQSFSQADASVTRKYGGTGLGLVITKGLVEMMNGSVYLESEKGKGSSFSFSVRLHVNKAEDAGAGVTEDLSFLNQNQYTEECSSVEEMFLFGTQENAQEIRNKMEKLIICIELGAWDKAEAFAHNIKKLVEQGPEELKKQIFRLSMSVRKSDYDKSIEQYEGLRDLLQRAIGGM